MDADKARAALDLWEAREQLAAANLELWQYKRAEAQRVLMALTDPKNQLPHGEQP